MSDRYVPTVGNSGYFDLLPPFDVQINQGERYTVKSVRTISDYIANNEDIKTDLYIKENILNDYESHLKDDIEIVSIQSERGHWLQIPSIYIKSYPIVNGIPYRAVSIVLPLQPIPTDTDLSTVLSKLSDVILSELGFSSIPTIVEASRVILVSTDKHASINLDRALSKNSFTDAERISMLNNDLAIALDKITALETYITNNI